MGVLSFLRSNGQYIFVGETIMAVVVLIIILCELLIERCVLFYLKSDGQYILVSDTIMAVFLLLLYCVTF